MKEKTTKSILVDVKAGYSRKINMHEHGGVQYEMADITEEMIAKNIPFGHTKDVSADLYTRCVARVETRIKMIDEKAEATPTKKTGIELDKAEMDEIIEIFNDITMAKSMKALRVCAGEVKTIAPSLKKSQIKFLRAHYKERVRSLKK